MAAVAIYSYVTSETLPRVLPIRLAVDLATVSGGGSTQATNGTERVKAAGRSRKSYGIHARYFTIARPIGIAGDYTSGSVKVKVTACAPGQMTAVGTIVTYKGKTDWKVISQTPEIIK